MYSRIPPNDGPTAAQIMAPTFRAATLPGIVIGNDGRITVLPLRQLDNAGLTLACLLSATLKRGLLVVV